MINPLKESFYLPLKVDEATYLRGCLRNYLRGLKSDTEQRTHLEVTLNKLENMMFNPDCYESKVF